MIQAVWTSLYDFVLFYREHRLTFIHVEVQWSRLDFSKVAIELLCLLEGAQFWTKHKQLSWLPRDVMPLRYLLMNSILNAKFSEATESTCFSLCVWFDRRSVTMWGGNRWVSTSNNGKGSRKSELRATEERSHFASNPSNNLCSSFSVCLFPFYLSCLSDLRRSIISS